MHLAGEYQTRERMEKKLAAVPLPDLHGKSVLDVGCDHGAWCSLAKERGANRVVGIDRGRAVRGAGFVDLAARNRISLPDCEFLNYELGRQYPLLDEFDVVLMLNLYHHVFNVCGDHESIWFWLWNHVSAPGVLLWENPTGVEDSVAHRNIRPELHAAYNYDAITAAASRYFHVTDVGDGWVPSRRVWECRPRTESLEVEVLGATVKSGAGGASKAFAYADARRAKEIASVLGFTPAHGSLNLQAAAPFHWDRKYFRAQILDVKDRKKGLDSEWAPRWCRFYPLRINDHRAYAMRFEGERYPETLVELVAPFKLRENLFLENGEEVCLAS